MSTLSFPTLLWLVRHRRAIERTAAAGAAVAGAYVALRFGLPEFFVFGLLAGTALGLAMRSCLELVTLICDMLLPK